MTRPFSFYFYAAAWKERNFTRILQSVGFPFYIPAVR